MKWIICGEINDKGKVCVRKLFRVGKNVRVLRVEEGEPFDFEVKCKSCKSLHWFRVVGELNEKDKHY